MQFGLNVRQTFQFVEHLLSKLAPVMGLEIKPNRRFGRTINNRSSIVQEEDLMLRILGLATVIVLSAFSAAAQTADEIIARYIKAVGGMDKIQESRRCGAAANTSAAADSKR
jgi:hypothetical protein